MVEGAKGTSPRALVLAPTGRDGAVICDILQPAGFTCEVCADITALLARLGDSGAAVITEEAFAGETAFEAMRGWLASQPPWSDFPFVLLSLRGDDAEQRWTPLRDLLGNITLLERPFRPDTLVRTVRSAARARQRQLETARLLQERAIAEAERRAGEERLRELFENAADAIFIADADNCLTDVNPAACLLLGFDRAELSGQAMSHLIAEEDLPAFNRWLEAQADRLPASAEWRFRRKNGELLDVEVSARILNDGRWQAFARDIGARKQAQASLRHLNETLEARVMERTAELVEAQAALAQAQKMEAVGQLTGGVAHDFNNLLTVISGGLDMLDRHQNPERRQRVTEGMRQAVERGAALTRQLLTFSRRQPLKPETLALDKRIAAMGELLERSLRGDIQVNTKFTSDLWPVHVDPTQFELAVLNLAVNARDAMPQGGTLTLRAHNVPGVDDPDVKGDFVEFSVSDTGSGIAPEVLARVFEPFFTTKDVGKGSGLGLAQVYGFAKESGGVVRIQSELSKGTKVTLMLPCSKNVSAFLGLRPGARERTAVKEPSFFRGRRVLLVEDDNDVASVAADMISQLGCEVIRVDNGAAALSAMTNGRSVDVVFSDIMMPGGMSGGDLARELILRWPNLPVVLTTGYHRQSVPAADDLDLPLLRKPYRIDTLANVLAAALSGTEADEMKD